MKYKIKEDVLRNMWGMGLKITLYGKRYRVGKMSYGDYFFEPITSKKIKETDPFLKGTIWPEKDGEWYYLYAV